MTYNGWKNWETWNTVNWLSSDEYLYREATRVARNGGDLRQVVEDWFKVDDIPVGLARDFVYMSLHEVDWDKIAEGLRE